MLCVYFVLKETFLPFSIEDVMINLEMIIAEKTDVKIPTINVVANDSISPRPKIFKMIATNK
ncbi:hypothetical protein D3C71_869300 [compost metagenome]